MAKVCDIIEHYKNILSNTEYGHLYVEVWKHGLLLHTKCSEYHFISVKMYCRTFVIWDETMLSLKDLFLFFSCRYSSSFYLKCNLVFSNKEEPFKVVIFRPGGYISNLDFGNI